MKPISLFTLLMSFENTIILLIIFYAIINIYKNSKLDKIELQSFHIFLVIFIGYTTIPYASATSNLGLAI